MKFDMSFEEAKKTFLNRGYVEVDGGTIFDGDKWRLACLVISDFLKDLPDWTPVEKELPKKEGWYQCTVITNDLPWTMELFYKNGKWLDNRRINMLEMMFDTYDIYGYGNNNEKHKLSYQELISDPDQFEWTDNVLAWKPLPKPYDIKQDSSK